MLGPFWLQLLSLTLVVAGLAQSANALPEVATCKPDGCFSEGNKIRRPLPDLDRGTGGITITSINGVYLPEAVQPGRVTVSVSDLAHSKAMPTFNGTVTITNVSAAGIAGPLQVIFFGVTAQATLANATGTLSGTPYITVSAPVSLAPGKSVNVSVQFENPANTAINFVPVIYSGSFK